ncbi:MAG: hypothetical protein ACRC7N_02225 [Clostridium sp.]
MKAPVGEVKIYKPVEVCVSYKHIEIFGIGVKEPIAPNRVPA